MGDFFAVHGIWTNFSKLAPLTSLAFIDGNIVIQLLLGLISFHRVDVLVSDALFSVAGPGAWITVATMQCSRREQLETLVATLGVTALAGGYSLMVSIFLSVFLSKPIFLNIMSYCGAIAIGSVAYLVMGVKIPGGNKTPWVIISFGIITGILACLVGKSNSSIQPLQTSPIEAATALVIIILLAYLSILPFALFGKYVLERFVEVRLLRFMAGMSVMTIAALVAGLSLSPLIIILGGLPAIVLLKRGGEEA
jgi:hypothetical protein